MLLNVYLKASSSSLSCISSMSTLAHTALLFCHCTHESSTIWSSLARHRPSQRHQRYQSGGHAPVWPGAELDMESIAHPPSKPTLGLLIRGQALLMPDAGHASCSLSLSRSQGVAALTSRCFLLVQGSLKRPCCARAGCLASNQPLRHRYSASTIPSESDNVPVNEHVYVACCPLE